MSILKQRANLKNLENELENSIRADELYKLQNDAKLRAIEQRVPTYEHFRNMVQAAHLKPLDRSELNKKPEICWNHCYNKKDESIIGNKKIPLQPCKYTIDDALEPRNSTEFLNIWKCITEDEQKFKYLLKFRNKLKDKYFRIEVPTEFFEDFAQLSLTNCSEETISQIIDILEVLSECNRFTLSLSMISVSRNNPLVILFKKMLAESTRDDEINKIENLMKKYCISLGN